MSRPLKRRRVSAARPISKTLLFFSDTIGATDKSQTLLTATFPCTIVGLRWELDTLVTVGTADQIISHYINWAIVLVKEGNVLNTLPNGNEQVASSLYNPEQNVLASGSSLITIGGFNMVTHPWKDSTKTMRKLQTGDRLMIVYSTGTSDALDNPEFGGSVQFFCKS